MNVPDGHVPPHRIAGGGRPRRGDAADAVPWSLRVAAAASWRFLVVLTMLGVIAWTLGYLAKVTVPIGIALLLSALFAPLVERLVRWHVPRALATLVAIIVGLAVLGGVLTLVVTTVTASLPQLGNQVGASLTSINNWLQHGPLHLPQVQQLLDKAVSTIQGNTAELTTRVLSTAATVGGVLTEMLLTLFVLVFFLYGGNQVWHFLLRIVPVSLRDEIDVAGRRGFASLVSYVRATVAVACVDAVCIGLGIWLVGVPLAVPLAALIFIGAFVPILGAVVTGAVAVLIALVANGFVAAGIVLAIVVAVMQLESHVLQPFLLGRAVRLHPLAVVLGIALGLEVAGIVGALLAVPILAVAKAAFGSLLRDPHLDPVDIDPLLPGNARAVASRRSRVSRVRRRVTARRRDDDDEFDH
ncbi:putative PurR-regulated permease PerM [Amycolatopsis echigonensis]|uniref:PurR-regulated permease PerM n=1 Tax=Amycolatopsis echigonensis TaxID=2576905 RepID=A0A2N3WTK7_9PSEU|nr:AI-2E family transporter [Amycolatopsis niigatensis]PKV97208.1 putative PurR-regulated permease PerM [Amycolatopsis niigatensis]